MTADDPYAELIVVGREKPPRKERDVSAPPDGSEEKLALAFAGEHAGEFRYVDAWHRWLIWNGRHWEFDETLRVYDAARAACRSAAAEAPTDKAAGALASAKTVAAVVMLARADRRIAASVDQWDVDPWLLNTPAGVMDLRIGEQRASRPADYMTRITGAPADATCATPLWLGFLDRVSGGDESLRRFIQRMSGYALTGVTREHAMFFCFGTGANGKTVLLRTLAACLGTYHRTAPIEAFTMAFGERHPTELAGLRGARLVTATETEEGRHWAESRIKALTGGDTIAARFMRQDFFEFVPQFKLVIAGNHKPGLRNVDEAIRRRLHLVPFLVTIPENERDETLMDRLQAELPGILAWALDGCIDWQERGLAPPVAVADATAAYLEAEDAIASWITATRSETARTEEQDRDAWEASASLFAAWKGWADKTGEPAGSMKRLAQHLEKHGLTFHRLNTGRGFKGLRLPPRVCRRCDPPYRIVESSQKTCPACGNEKLIWIW